MRIQVLAYAALILLVVACTAPTNSGTEQATDQDSAFVDQDVAESSQEGSVEIQADPRAVVDALFNAARTKDYSQLAGLCDPDGESDGDARQICSMAFAPEGAKAEFVEYFQFGQVIGVPVVVADTAMVQVKFGKQGGRDESIRLIRRADKWYLASF